MKIALIGYGKMGKAIEELALKAGDEIVLKVDVNSDANWYKGLVDADVAIEFSSPDSAFNNLKVCIDNKVPVVCGTTGWYNSKQSIEDYCLKKNGCILIASNFSIGVNIFFSLNEYLAKIMAQYPEYQVTMEEIHHTAKLDQPSGTALTLANTIIDFRNDIDSWTQDINKVDSQLYIESVRQDPAPGTHKVFYDSLIDSIEITHTAHSRIGFAAGALMAAKWICEKKGIFTMKNIIS